MINGHASRRGRIGCVPPPILHVTKTLCDYFLSDTFGVSVNKLCRTALPVQKKLELPSGFNPVPIARLCRSYRGFYAVRFPSRRFTRNENQYATRSFNRLSLPGRLRSFTIRYIPAKCQVSKPLRIGQGR